MIFSTISSLVVTSIMIPPIVRTSRAKQLVAMPNGRTSHHGGVPTLGGMAIFAAVVIGSGLFMPDSRPAGYQYILPAMIILFFFGLKDDIVGINPRKKLAGQMVASLIVIIVANIRLTTLHGIFGIEGISDIAGIVITLLLFIGLINAFNLIDGVDGLASGLGIFISMVFGIWLALLGRVHFAILAFSLTGSLIAFFRFNVFSLKYKLFMGDTGSMLLGFIFALLAVEILCCPIAPDSNLFMEAFPVVVLSLMIIPIADSVRVMTRRILNGKSPFHADRTHCHHDLLSLGFSHIKTSIVLVAANAGLFFLAMLLKDLPVVLLGTIMMSAGLFACCVPRMFLKRVVKETEVVILDLTFPE